jgi:SAM-dependent methyltransferase
VSGKLETRYRYESEASIYFAKRRFYFSYVGLRMINAMNTVINLISNSDLKILDVGSGPGFFERNNIQENLSDTRMWVSLDIAENMVKMQYRDSPAIDAIVADAEHLPFRDSTFDIVLMSRAIKFMDPRKALEESRRVSKKVFILFADVADTLWAYVMERLFGITVDPAVWNNYRTPSSKNIEIFLRNFFIRRVKFHITAMPLSIFNILSSFLIRIFNILDKPYLGSRIVCYVCLK